MNCLLKISRCAVVAASLLGAGSAFADAQERIDDLTQTRYEEGVADAKTAYLAVAKEKEAQFDRLLADTAAGRVQPPSAYLAPISQSAARFVTLAADLGDAQTELYELSLARANESEKKEGVRTMATRALLQQRAGELAALGKPQNQATYAFFQAQADVVADRVRAAGEPVAKQALALPEIADFLTEESAKIQAQLQAGKRGSFLFSKRKRLLRDALELINSGRPFDAEAMLERGLQDGKVVKDADGPVGQLYAYVLLINRSNPRAIAKATDIIASAYRGIGTERLAGTLVRLQTAQQSTDEELLMKLIDHRRFSGGSEGELNNLAFAHFIAEERLAEARELYDGMVAAGTDTALSTSLVSWLLLKQGDFPALAASKGGDLLLTATR